MISLTEFLSGFITTQRRERIDHVLDRRTRRITVVLEDIFQPHNASAVIRSCDCFGIQDLHVIENRNTYTLNPDVELGSAQWISLKKWKGNANNTQSCLNSLKAKGYKLLATTPHKPTMSIAEVKMNQKVALLFGTEKEGLSSDAMELADERINIPMEGFTESFNISVSAALCMFQLRTRLNEIKDWGLSPEEKEDLRLSWIKSSLGHPGQLVAEYHKKYG